MFITRQNIYRTNLVHKHVNTMAYRDLHQPQPANLVDQLSTAVILLDEDLNIQDLNQAAQNLLSISVHQVKGVSLEKAIQVCLLYTSDAADEEDSVDLGGRRIIKTTRRDNAATSPNCLYSTTT